MTDEPFWSPEAVVYDPLKIGSIDGTDEYPHDHGIVRAMNATYKPPRHLDTDPKRTVFVSRLSSNTDEKRLAEIFDKYGRIVNCVVIRDAITGFSKRYAFVEFENVNQAFRAREDANRTVVDSAEIFVDMERERTLPGWVPRRLGGGFGGRKESGQLRFGCSERPFRKPLDLNTASGRNYKQESRREASYAENNYNNRRDNYHNNDQGVKRYHDDRSRTSGSRKYSSNKRY
ncbi:U11/U12 small nuclear ribonucleoprotein 35 kDa protein-like [Tubulanus polymorphus]|uniref:U11/U12 small nuclear ribonucleoprotein 35 kDa protein-like n=1 Tax=Tubulanus polymorphus TaxID=672921 RepID=UPI003DA4961B